VLRLFLIALALAFLSPLLVVVVLLAAAQAQCGNGTPTANVTAPAGNPATEGQFVHYFESQHIPADAAAGIVGNLEQENTLNPVGTFGAEGMAQWNESWWAVVSAWISAHGQAPGSVGGQLMYLATVVTTGVPRRPGRRRRREIALEHVRRDEPAERRDVLAERLRGLQRRAPIRLGHR